MFNKWSAQSVLSNGLLNAAYMTLVLIGLMFKFKRLVSETDKYEKKDRI